MRQTRYRGIAAQFIILIAATVSAQTTQPDISQTIQRLSSNNWSTRQAAQQSLVQMGDSAEPSLRAAMKNPLDPETRSRVEEALSQIDANRITGPTLVSLDYDNADVSTVLDDLARQGHAQFETPNIGWLPAPRRLTIHVQRQPFWIAMKQVCDKTGLSPQFGSSDHKMTLLQGGDFMSGIAQCQGPFMIVARRITQNAEVWLGGNRPERRSAAVEMTVLAEPKLTLVGHAYGPRLETVSDDAGHSLKPRHWERFNPMMFNSMNLDDSHLWMTGVNMECPNDHAKKITELRGSIRVGLETRSGTWTITDILKAQHPTRTFGLSAYSIDSVTQTQNVYMVRISGSRPAENSGAAFLGLGQIDMFDAKGKALTRRSLGGGGGMSRMMYNFAFDAADPANPTGAPVKLIWKVPVATKVVDVPFVFRDLPLP